MESVYEQILAFELRKRGHKVETQRPIDITYDGHRIEDAFRADLVIDDKLIVELKSVEKVSPVHRKQLLTYLKLSGKKLGLLINFGEARIKDGITRLVNGLADESL